MTTEQIARLASRLIDLGVRPDDEDDYDEFEDVVNELISALNTLEGRPNWDDL